MAFTILKNEISCSEQEDGTQAPSIPAEAVVNIQYYKIMD
jgi:hypothetical protein